MGQKAVCHRKGDHLLARGFPGGDCRRSTPSEGQGGTTSLHPRGSALHPALLSDRQKRTGSPGEPLRGLLLRAALFHCFPRPCRCRGERNRDQGHASFFRLHLHGYTRFRGQTPQEDLVRIGVVPSGIQRVWKNRRRGHGQVPHGGQHATLSLRHARRAPMPSFMPHP